MAGDVHFMQALEESKPVRALVRALNRLRGALPRIFALSVMRNNPEPDPDDADAVENRIDDFRKLAEVVWQKNAPSQYGSDVMSFNTIKDTFNTSVEEVSMFSLLPSKLFLFWSPSSNNLKQLSSHQFRIMKKNVQDYLRDDQTMRFLLRDVSVAGRENFSRQDALNQVFQPKTMTVWMQGVRNSAYDHILSRSFESLRNLHEQYFRRPSQYSVSRI